MNSTTTEDAILTYEVSDDAMETAAGMGKELAPNFTLGACTALSSCPD
jgi:hypothetical protein